MKIYQIVTSSFFCLILGLTGCGERTVEVPKNIVENTWGIPFVITPVSKASLQIQNFGKAISYVDYAEGGSATGFFISSDGLFLTNEHVIPRDRCGTTCKGIRLIRNVTPGGDFEIFDSFKVIAHNEELDFALLQVELGAGKSVPFLELDSERANQEGAYKDKMVIVGHIMGGSLQTVDAILDDKSETQLYLKSVANGGNSGSPLMNIATGKVVGLYHASQWIKGETSVKTGLTPHFGQAMKLDRIVEALRSVFPDFKKSNEWKTSQFVNRDTTNALSEGLLPNDKVPDLTTQKSLSFNEFIHYYQGTELENQALEKIKEIEDKSVTGAEGKVSFLKSLVAFNRAIGQSEILKTKTVTLRKFLTEKDFSFDNKGSSTVVTSLGLGTVEQCISKRAESDDRWARAAQIIGRCSSLEDENKKSLMPIVLDMLDPIDYSKKPNYFGGVAGPIIKVSSLTKISKSDKQAYLDQLERIITNATTIDLAFSAEGLFTFVQHDLDFTGPGSFSKTIK